MKLLFDHHLSPELATYFQDDFPGSNHVHALGMSCVDDTEIWEFSRANDFVIVTKDSDFHDLGMRLGFPPYVVLIKRGNCGTKIIKQVIEFNKDGIKQFTAADKSGILILF